MNDSECVRFLQETLPRAGFRWAGYRKVRRLVCKRARRRARELGLSGLDAYARHLEQEPAELAVLDAFCRIPISRFYRDRGVFDFLLERGLPTLIAEARGAGRSRISVWSAGCASGEEPYTLSILWRQAFAPACPDLHLSVLATDADEAMIARARAGRYTAGCLKELPTSWRAAAFREKEGDFSLRPAYRADIDFAVQDIRRTMPDGKFDLVLCRNLAFTYFETEVQRRVLSDIRDRIRPGGMLVIGRHERLPAEVAGFSPFDAKLGTFRRAEDRGAVSKPAMVPNSPAKSVKPHLVRVRASLPIAEDLRIDLPDTEREELRRMARRLVADEPALSAEPVFGPRVVPGVGPGPAVLFEDHSGTALADRYDDSLLEYRAVFLAQDGDILLVGEPRDAQFEAYAKSLLDLSDVAIDRPAALHPGTPLAARCANDPRVMARLSGMARRSGALNLITYMGTGRVWELARQIASEAPAQICVAAPHPRLARRVNDKLWFTDRVNELLGRQSAPETVAVYGPTALAHQVKRLGMRHERIVIKVPDSGGSEGNLVVPSGEYAALDARETRDRLQAIMVGLGWGPTYPLSVSVWESPLLDSPSVQLWVPHREEGPPLIQGIFSQVVAGVAGEFVGAQPCALPSLLQYRIGREAVVLATLFQELGYFGPCSLDAVVTGGSASEAQVHWLECNGRWTGVSVPLVLVNRLTGSRYRRPFVIVQKSRLQGRGYPSFAHVLRLLGPRLFDPHSSASGTVVLTPARNISGTGLHFLVLGETVQSAREESEVVANLLLGDGAEAQNTATSIAPFVER